MTILEIAPLRSCARRFPLRVIGWGHPRARSATLGLESELCCSLTDLVLLFSITAGKAARSGRQPTENRNVVGTRKPPRVSRCRKVFQSQRYYSLILKKVGDSPRRITNISGLGMIRLPKLVSALASIAPPCRSTKDQVYVS